MTDGSFTRLFVAAWPDTRRSGRGGSSARRVRFEPSHVDITYKTIDGGIFHKGTLGINWWATRRWKIGFDCGLIELERKGMTGTTHAFHTRIQRVY